MQRLVLLIFAFWLLACGPSNAETIKPVKAAVFRSTGTVFLGMTIWPELNSNWSAYGNVPVQIDYDSLAGNDVTLGQLEDTGADVVILSNPAFWTYKPAEMGALKQYIEAGHGLIISYGKFRSADHVLAPLVGLGMGNAYGTGTAIDPLQVELLQPEHFFFEGIQQPYETGVRTVAYAPYGTPWTLDGGTVIGNLRNEVVTPIPGIITNETPDFRGVYFSYYIEDAGGGSNAQDKQVFYNSLLWAAGLPEPASGLLFFFGLTIVLLRRSR